MDQQLIQNSIAGDSQALETLLTRHQHWMLDFAHKRMSAAMLACIQPEDIVQMAMIEVFRRIRNFVPARDPLDSFRGWLGTILVTTIRLAARRNKHRLQRLEDEVCKAVADSALTPRHSATRRERWERLSEAVGKLPQSLREPVILYYMQEKDIAEVAAIMGLAPSTITPRLQRARKRLHELLEASPLYLSSK